MSTTNFVLQILPPASVTVGDYNFTAVITTPDNVTISHPLTLKLNSGTSMTVNYDKLQYTSSPGQTFTIPVYVTNSGKGGALTNVYPDITAPSGWIVSSSPNLTTSLTSGNTQVFTVSVQSPGNIVASDYDVNVNVKSDQAASDDRFQDNDRHQLHHTIRGRRHNPGRDRRARVHIQKIRKTVTDRLFSLFLHFLNPIYSKEL